MQTDEPGACPWPRRQLRVLLIPADPDEPASVVDVPDSSRAISDVLGGCLLDDTVVVRGPACGSCTLYLADDSIGDGPVPRDNPRAATLAARLGLVDRRLQARIRGPVLIAGLCPDAAADIDVPTDVLAAAVRTGLTITAGAIPTKVTPRGVSGLI